jgi:hypothetical protein
MVNKKLKFNNKEKIPISNKNFIVNGKPENKIQAINIRNEKVGIECTNPEI